MSLVGDYLHKLNQKFSHGESVYCLLIVNSSWSWLTSVLHNWNSFLPLNPIAPGNPDGPLSPFIPSNPSRPGSPASPLRPGNPGDPGTPGSPENHVKIVKKN